MDTGQYDFVEAILTAHGIGRREGFENAMDVRELIEADGRFTGTDEGLGEADVYYLEALGQKVEELEARIRLIEQHYLGVDFTPENAQPKSRTCSDPACECSDTICGS